MDREEAARILGVAPGAGPETIRAAWRRRIAAHHPDRVGEAGTTEAAELNRAYAVLGKVGAPQPAEQPSPGPPAPPVASGMVLVDRSTVALDTAAGGIMELLTEVAHRIGDVSHLDREGGLLELIMTPDGGPPCSVVLTLAPRSGPATPPRPEAMEVHLSVESLDARPAPPTEAVAARFLDEVSRTV